MGSDTGNLAATGAVNGTASGVEAGLANFLAIQKSTGLFFDVQGTQAMDILCQYRCVQLHVFVVVVLVRNSLRSNLKVDPGRDVTWGCAGTT